MMTEQQVCAVHGTPMSYNHDLDIWKCLSCATKDTTPKRTPKCPACGGTEWVVKGSSNCLCPCGELFIITAANVVFADRVVR